MALTGHRLAWGCISVALTLMGIRRSITFYHVLADHQTLPDIPTAELVALCISVLMLIGVMLIGRMFRESNKQERLLENSERRFRDFAEMSSDWFWEMDGDLRFSYFSERFSEISGVRDEDLLGKTRRESGLNPNDAAIMKNIEDLEAHRPFKNFVHQRTKPDGSLVFMSTAGVPVFATDGMFQGYRGVGQDITQSKIAEAELRESLLRAERANRAKSEFLAHVSHELRTPLNAIMGFSQLIVAGTFEPVRGKNLEYSQDIYHSAEHLLGVITDILDISKIEAGEFTLDEADIDLAVPVQRAVDIVKVRAEEKNQTLINRVEPNLFGLHADSRLIRQILVNLLSNAIKFTGETGRIEVAVSRAPDGGLTLSVTDNGIGVRAEDIPRILEPFGQVRTNAMLAAQGTGLGLSLSKRLADIHGGDLAIESEPGQGTTVRVTLPAQRVRN